MLRFQRCAVSLRREAERIVCGVVIEYETRLDRSIRTQIFKCICRDRSDGRPVDEHIRDRIAFIRRDRIRLVRSFCQRGAARIADGSAGTGRCRDRVFCQFDIDRYDLQTVQLRGTAGWSGEDQRTVTGFGNDQIELCRVGRFRAGSAGRCGNTP